MGTTHHHCYADKPQLYLSVMPETNQLVKLQKCLKDTKSPNVLPPNQVSLIMDQTAPGLCDTLNTPPPPLYMFIMSLQFLSSLSVSLRSLFLVFLLVPSAEGRLTLNLVLLEVSSCYYSFPVSQCACSWGSLDCWGFSPALWGLYLTV